MSIEENTRPAVKATALAYAIAFCLLFALGKNLPIAIAASPVVALIIFYRVFTGELRIVTSDGTSFRILNKSKKFLAELKGVVEMAKTRGDSYTINNIDNSIEATATNISNTNSPLSTVGIGNTTRIEGSSIAVGTSIEQRQRQGASIGELLELVKTSKLLPKDDRDAAVRHLQNVQEQNSKDKPNTGVIAYSLEQLKSILTTAAAGAELAEKAKSVFDMF
jgi:hypothetical protein